VSGRVRPWFDDFFVQEELLFPEFGGVIGTVVMDCPAQSSRRGNRPTSRTRTALGDVPE
jgi:hypothetical protein